MPKPVFGFLAFTSGAYEGAIIRDMRLANALHRRGYKVVIYWMMETNRELVDQGIRQYVFCNGVRFHFQRPSRIMELTPLQNTYCNGVRFHFQRPSRIMELLGGLRRLIPAARRRAAP